MLRIEKSVFISYRRTNVPWALNVYQDLTHHGYDVFFDFEGIGSGDFESIIVDNITSRAHFLILLTPSALERCGRPRRLAPPRDRSRPRNQTQHSPAHARRLQLRHPQHRHTGLPANWLCPQRIQRTSPCRRSTSPQRWRSYVARFLRCAACVAVLQPATQSRATGSLKAETWWPTPAPPVKEEGTYGLQQYLRAWHVASSERGGDKSAFITEAIRHQPQTIQRGPLATEAVSRTKTKGERRCLNLGLQRSHPADARL